MVRHATTATFQADGQVAPPTFIGRVPFAHTANDELLFLNEEFLKKSMKEGYECAELGMALAHWCFKNYKLSRKVAKILVKGINSCDYEKIKNYIEIVHAFLALPDEYKRERLEWIFGYSTLQVVKTVNDDLPRFGVTAIDHFSDESYTYHSQVAYNKSDDSLFLLLGRY